MQFLIGRLELASFCIEGSRLGSICIVIMSPIYSTVSAGACLEHFKQISLPSIVVATPPEMQVSSFKYASNFVICGSCRMIHTD